MSDWLVDLSLSLLILMWSLWRLKSWWRSRYGAVRAHHAKSLLYASWPLLALLSYWVAKF